MCRNIKKLRRNGQRPTEAELHDAALQFIRKISGYREPSLANQKAFQKAVRDVASASGVLFRSLKVRTKNESSTSQPNINST
jgi:hypothetical protein